ncbi:hypothetical protein GGR95_001436 [Sulfitobacter undariae]|uniref:Hemolysin-type calcium-binding repeat-containing protein n=1 Tax=Sulfitobacter undariae TaxID=1563671 RepID=A0A7W6E2Z8_9RHOB|nr:calcium-binding protein [Sulfitobacter undariae]MBB3993805.1 hypothetical protein [Sulfitobacter undariae]
MLMLLSLALPLALLGFALDSNDDDHTEAEEIEGGEGDDRLEGNTGDDFIDGNAGDDVMNGRAGNDTIFGRDGEDVLVGEAGDDMLCSGDGDDFVTGNTGQDLIEGQGGDDFLSGDYGWDTVRGDEGNDTVIGGRGGDMVAGGEGDDVVFGGIIENLPLNLTELTELRDGGELTDINGGIDMRDDSVGNRVWGGAGDDDLILGSGDIANGHEGSDTYHIMSEQVGDVAPVIASFVPSDDAITVIVDDIDEDADISVSDDGDDAVIRMGDTVLARVAGGAGTLTAADISLIAENTIEQMFEPNPAVV